MKLLIAFFALLLITTAAHAAAPYTVQDAFIRATPMKISSAYLLLKNPTAHNDELQSATAAWAGRIELHNITTNDKGVMTMAPVRTMALPAKGTLSLRPGGFHLMIFDIAETLKPGTQKTITLHFKNAGDMSVPFTVQPISYGGDHSHMHGM